MSAGELAQLSAIEFFARYEDRPVVVTGLVHSAPELSLADVVAACPRAEMPTYAGESAEAASSAREEGGAAGAHKDWARLKRSGSMPIGTFAEYVERVTRAPEPQLLYGFDMVLAQECPTLRARLALPPFASECLLQEHLTPNRRGTYLWPSMMAGPKGTRSELHTDNSGLAFWMAVHHGRKHWLVLPHGANAHLSEGLEPDQVLAPATGRAWTGSTLQQYMAGAGYAFRAFAPDFDKFPKLCEAVVFGGEVKAGEVIFIPNAAPHAALNLEATVATTSNFFHPADARQQRWLRKVCEEPEGGLAFLEESPRWLRERCADLLAHVARDAASGKWAARRRRLVARAPPAVWREAGAEPCAGATAGAAAECAAAAAAPPPPPPPPGDDPMQHLAAWLRDSPVPTEPAEGWPAWDLGSVPAFDREHLAAEPRGLLLHAQPPRAFFSRASREQAVLVVAKLLRAALERASRGAAAVLRAAPARDADLVLASARALFDSVEDFYHQAVAALHAGWHQLDPAVKEWREYGAETNFWLRFRPYLQCKRSPRLGEEVGGYKAWCNPEFLFGEHGAARKPRNIFSAGSGDDFSYEDFVLRVLPQATVFTADCFAEDTSGGGFGPRLVFVPECVHGGDQGDISMLEPEMRAKFTTLPRLIRKLRAQRPGFDTFELIKANIEAYEYGTFATALRDADEDMRGTAQIHIEMHRLGMQDRGRSWSSLVLGELLFATFFAAGFHPVATEKWHDSTGAQDVLFVNGTWYIESELFQAREGWKHPRSAAFLRPALKPLVPHAFRAGKFNGFQVEGEPWQEAAAPAAARLAVRILAPANLDFDCNWLDPDQWELTPNEQRLTPTTPLALQTSVGHVFVCLEHGGGPLVSLARVRSGVLDYHLGPSETRLALQALQREHQYTTTLKPMLERLGELHLQDATTN